ncbi:DNA polymerase-3 subunit beta [Pseudobutyrivibrio sp. 49]|uniref:DNA polymerase III subunit beta n=1 Tax=unclassified Pseudobutyrivibrio TaxID=2638619 RepID=UPI000884C660|nr:MULTISPECIES: DNA polymerase III subunit beta [unclassified Pseudobutyrivibrio]SDH68370.1 DNA polymerase-3 subunit beta [Pseudobutyrivibrio sp. 49]SFN72270.1 DNA polymerase-3 subunit beta [Pseudobutyrivibrio sp. UC1225]
MKITCQKSDLVKGVNIVSKAVPTRTTMAILECILIDASAGEIKLTANDMEIGIETIVNGTISERGIIALDAKKFSEIVRKLPDNEVTIETDSSYKTSITCEKAKFDIIGKSGEDFSYLPNIQRNQPIIISQLTLRDIIRQTIFSVADNENNKMMTGELIEIKDNKLKVVALDGHRVSIRNVELKNPADDVKVVVPKKTLNEIIKIVDGGIDDEVNIFVTDNHIIFEFDQTTVVSRIIEGEYFKIEQMLSADYETKIKINKREFFDCIDRATILVNEGDKKPIIVNAAGSTMSLSISSFIGSMNEDIDIVKEGKDIMIGFNPKFVMDALKVIDDEEINLYMLNAKSPCFIKDDEGSFIYIVLPVNFNNPGAN